MVVLHDLGCLNEMQFYRSIEQLFIKVIFSDEKFSKIREIVLWIVETQQKIGKFRISQFCLKPEFYFRSKN